MATIAKLGIKLEADGSAFASNLDQATTGAKALEAQAKKTEAAAKKMADEAEKAAKKAADAAEKQKEKSAKESSLGGKLESLNKTFGADSALGKISGALMGGAVLGGLSMLAGGFEKVAEKAANLAKEFARGKIDAREYAVEMGMNIPILGSVAKGMLSTAEAALALMGGKSWTVVSEEGLARIEKLDKAFAAMREGAKQTEKLQQDLVEARLTGTEKELYQAEQRAADAEKAAREAFALDSKVDKTAGSRLREQLDLIKQRLEVETEKIKNAPILEKAKENAKYVEEQMKQIRKDAEQASMNDMQKTLDNLKRAGASAAEIDQAFKDLSAKKAAEEAAQALKDMQKMSEEAEKAAANRIQSNKEKIQQTLDELEKQIDQFRMSEADRKAEDVRKLGASASNVEAVRNMQKELDLLERKKAIVESLETPQQKYNKQLKELNELSAKGLLTQDEYSQAALKNLEEFKASQKSLNKVGSVGIAQIGSAEAATALQKAGATGGNQGQKALLDIQKKQLEYQKKQTEQNAKILAGEGIIKFTVATL